MNRSELASQVSARTGLKKKDAEAAVAAVFDCAAEALAEGEKLSISGFGVFDSKERAARTVHSPLTGEEIRVPAAKVPVFRPAKQLKEKVNAIR